MAEYTQVERDAAVRMYTKNKWGYLKISKVIGCSKTTVRDWILDAEIKPREASGYKPSKKKKAVEDYLKNKKLSLKRAAKKHGVGEKTLTRWVNEKKKKTRPQRPRKYDRDKILKDLEDGYEREEVAARNGCSVRWVYRVQAGE